MCILHKQNHHELKSPNPPFLSSFSFLVDDGVTSPSPETLLPLLPVACEIDFAVLFFRELARGMYLPTPSLNTLLEVATAAVDCVHVCMYVGV